MNDEFTAEQKARMEDLLSKHFTSPGDIGELAGFLQQSLQQIAKHRAYMADIGERASLLRDAVLAGDMDEVRRRVMDRRTSRGEA